MRVRLFRRGQPRDVAKRAPVFINVTDRASDRDVVRMRLQERDLLGEPVRVRQIVAVVTREKLGPAVA